MESIGFLSYFNSSAVKNIIAEAIKTAIQPIIIATIFLPFLLFGTGTTTGTFIIYSPYSAAGAVTSTEPLWFDDARQIQDLPGLSLSSLPFVSVK